MSRIGLRVGGLPGLSIYGERWTTATKGHEQSGQVPDEVRKAIEGDGLPLRSPFAELTAPQIADRFRLLVGRLLKARQIRERYSVHDVRHAFAIRLYRACRDTGRKSVRGRRALSGSRHARRQVSTNLMRLLF
jgi:ribosomal protein S13